MVQLERILKSVIPFAAAAALLGGCNADNKHEDSDASVRRDAMQFNEPDHTESAVERLAKTQIAAGVRTDATLRSYHFDNGRLNSLGREKLDCLSAPEFRGDDELVVYLDASTGDSDADKKIAQARQDAVTEYLMSRGLGEDSFRLESGSNPSNTVAAASLRGSGGADAAATGGSGASKGAGQPATGGTSQSAGGMGSGDKK